MENFVQKLFTRYLLMANSASEGTPTQTSSYSEEEHLSEESVTRGLVNICEALQRWEVLCNIEKKSGVFPWLRGKLKLEPELSFCLLIFYQILSLASFLPTWIALRTVSDVKAVEILSSVETLKITFDP